MKIMSKTNINRSLRITAAVILIVSRRSQRIFSTPIERHRRSAARTSGAQRRRKCRH